MTTIPTVNPPTSLIRQVVRTDLTLTVIEHDPASMFGSRYQVYSLTPVGGATGYYGLTITAIIGCEPNLPPDACQYRETVVTTDIVTVAGGVALLDQHERAWRATPAGVPLRWKP